MCQPFEQHSNISNDNSNISNDNSNISNDNSNISNDNSTCYTKQPKAVTHSSSQVFVFTSACHVTTFYYVLNKMSICARTTPTKADNKYDSFTSGETSNVSA